MLSTVSPSWRMPATAPAAGISSTESEDPLIQAYSLSKWSQEYTQLSNGKFLGRTVDLSLGPVQLLRETMSQAVDQNCQPLTDCYSIGIAAHAGGTWQNRPLEADKLFLLPRGEAARLRTPLQSDILVAFIDRAEMQRSASQILGVDADKLFEGQRVKKVDEAAARRFRAGLHQIMLAALDAPDALNYEAATRRMSEAITETCLDVLGSAFETPRVERDALRVHRAIVERAREFILAHRETPPTVTELCAYLNMSRRGVHYAFMQVLDVNPVTFIRNVRLHAVRRALLQGDAPSVSAAAHHWGFWHLGMFSCYYKELFGELPSETAKKSPGLKRVRWLVND
ncbi:helix-turn-helix domain-containing protein [Azohydromonas lata]|uniref:helix-turn-helix domain-containing protein n=1 Tax=Azohydromonas lata TaxID=45677 RepID=UPI001471D153|nr:helix-turn-helix domain-containing protein [Azohydromonas lata]